MSAYEQSGHGRAGPEKNNLRESAARLGGLPLDLLQQKGRKKDSTAGADVTKKRQMRKSQQFPEKIIGNHYKVINWSLDKT